MYCVAWLFRGGKVHFVLVLLILSGKHPPPPRHLTTLDGVKLVKWPFKCVSCTLARGVGEGPGNTDASELMHRTTWTQLSAFQLGGHHEYWFETISVLCFIWIHFALTRAVLRYVIQKTGSCLIMLVQRVCSMSGTPVFKVVLQCSMLSCVLGWQTVTSMIYTAEYVCYLVTA